MDKIICIGKNYLEHAQELGDAVPEDPVVFFKPPSVAVTVRNTQSLVEVSLPIHRGVIHYECEMICMLTAQGKIQAVSLGLDLTLRDVQSQMKKRGLPWEVAKSFYSSAVIGPWISVEDFPHFLEEEFQFSLDGKLCQKAKPEQMRFSPQDCIRYVQSLLPLVDGDVLFTGTPVGVGALQDGQVGQLRWGKHLFYEVRFHLK